MDLEGISSSIICDIINYNICHITTINLTRKSILMI